MAIAITLKPETEARLVAQAQAQGMPVQDLLEIALNMLFANSDEATTSKLAPDAKATEFVKWARKHSSKAPPLSDEAVSRESIYAERETAQL